MNRGTWGVTAASAMFVVSMAVIPLGCEIAAAAEPGFYVGAAGGRSEQRLDRQAGVLFAKQEVESKTIIESPTAIVGRPIERDYSDEVFTVGAGVQWAFLPRWTARLEYQRSDDLQPNDIMGESRLDQASLSVLFGL